MRQRVILEMITASWFPTNLKGICELKDKVQEARPHEGLALSFLRKAEEEMRKIF